MNFKIINILIICILFVNNYFSQISRFKSISDYRYIKVTYHNRNQLFSDTLLDFNQLIKKRNYMLVSNDSPIINKIKTQDSLSYYTNKINLVHFYIVVKNKKIEKIYLFGQYQEGDFKEYLSEFIKQLYANENEIIHQLFNKRRKEYGVILRIPFTAL